MADVHAYVAKLCQSASPCPTLHKGLACTNNSLHRWSLQAQAMR